MEAFKSTNLFEFSERFKDTNDCYQYFGVVAVNVKPLSGVKLGIIADVKNAIMMNQPLRAHYFTN